MKWNLDGFYTNEADYEKDILLLDELINAFPKFKGTLHEFKNFKEYHLHEEKTISVMYRLYGFAHLSSDLNLKDQPLQSRYQKLLIKMNELSSMTSFVSPEIISIGEEKIMSFIDKDEKLSEYRFNFEKLFKQQDHVLLDKEEKLLSFFSPISNVPTQLYQSLSLTDRVDEKVTLSDGQEMTINTSNWRSILPKLKNAKDRDLVFGAAFKRYKDNKDAFAATYNLVLQNMASHYKARGYNSALESKLDGNNIPLDVFLTLKDTAYESYQPVRRYIKLRQQFLGLETYRTYDRFLTTVENPKSYSYEEGKDLFFKAIEGMDETFVANQKEALKEGYVDVAMSDGKRTGAYSSSLYGFHPYILLNHDNTLDGVFTIVHEAGHSAHSLFASEAQPLSTHRYTIFVAEIASTFNERILADYMLKHSNSKEEKITIIEHEIDGIMATFYRQTLFAHYEYEANKLIESGIPLNSTNLSKIMIDLYKHYYDIDITEEDGKQYVWAYIPHLFRTPFYVYQYASSYAASLKIYEDIKVGVPHAMDKYIKLLKSGGSKYPVDQAKEAGADLTKKETYQAVVKRFNALIDELEILLKQ